MGRKYWGSSNSVCQLHIQTGSVAVEKSKCRLILDRSLFLFITWQKRKVQDEMQRRGEGWGWRMIARFPPLVWTSLTLAHPGTCVPPLPLRRRIWMQMQVAYTTTIFPLLALLYSVVVLHAVSTNSICNCHRTNNAFGVACHCSEIGHGYSTVNVGWTCSSPWW